MPFEADAAVGDGWPLQIYVDGCCEPRSATGGWAFVVYRDGVEIASDSGRILQASNTVTELLAVLGALRWVNAQACGVRAFLWSDSAYVVNGCNQWRHIWKNRGWRKKGANPNGRARTIAHPELWQAIDAALLRHGQVDVAWCKGHAGIPGNERADALAELARSMKSQDHAARGAAAAERSSR